MQENTNKAIALNSIILYSKMVICTICALFSTRFALQALGVVDYGLYAVLGGIISFIGIFNTIMLSTSNRFIAVAIGKGDLDEVNKQFNVNFVIHLTIAIGALLVALPVGFWYIPNYINYEGSLSNAMMVYTVSVIGSVFSFVGVPYNGLLMAKERFVVFSLVEVVSQITRLVVAWLLVFNFEKKLLIYTITMAVMTAAPTVVYYLYCNNKYRNLVRFRFVRDSYMYKRVFGFSAWVAVGAVAHVGKNQGAALIVNAFFNTAMNTAMGVASSINAYIFQFAQSVTQPMSPQISKSYAASNHERTDELLIMSAKYSFMFTFLIGSVFLVAPEWLLSLWLKDVPEYSSVFLFLLVTDSIIRSLNSGVAVIIFACGKIGLFQALTSGVNIISIIAAFFVLKAGAPAYYLTITYIVFSVILFFVIQYCLHETLDYDNRKLWRLAYIPSIITACLFVPILFVPFNLHPIIRLVISFVYLVTIEWFICLSGSERTRIWAFIIKAIKKR